MHRDIFYQLYYHFTWSTMDRHVFLEDTQHRAYMIRMVQEAAQRHGGHVLACSAMPDHVHLLVALAPGDIAQYIGRVKGASSFGFNKEFAPAYKLIWQDGYGVVSLRKSDTDMVTHYIENQEIIHANRQTFPELEVRGAPLT